MINADQIVDLLTLSAVFDQRTAGPEDVAGWLAVAQTNRWDAPAARRVILEHYGSAAARPRITPAAITDRIRAVRSQAAASFDAPRIPDDLLDRDYPDWYRAKLADHVDRVLDRWAADGTEPPLGLPAIPPAVSHARELPAAAPPPVRGVVRRGVQRMLARRPEGDPHTRAQARAELDAHRPATHDPDPTPQQPHTAPPPPPLEWLPGQSHPEPLRPSQSPRSA
ncbi:MAG: hypothetical protein ACRCZP_18945 [Phycicoccus sp.]